MITRALILAGLFTVTSGCASSQKQSCCDKPAARVEAIDQFDRAVTASALMFDPPSNPDELPLELAREGRERSAFVAYEDQTVTFSYVRIDDRQTGDNRERYERQAIVERFGSSSR